MHRDHVASNAASNTGIASNNASNGESVVVPGEGRGLPEVGMPDLRRMREMGAAGERKQRWSREAYNAYQKEYMRKKRALRAVHD